MSSSPSLLVQPSLSTADDDSHSTSVVLSSPSYSTVRVQPRPTGVVWNRLCGLACCCFRCGPCAPLFVAFQHVPTARKTWWVWLMVTQVAASQYATLALGQVILSVWAVILLISLAWAIASGGFHRGISLVQLLGHIPLAVYLCMRLAGLDNQDFDNSSLKDDKRLWIFAIVEVITLGLACVGSFVDVLYWLLGRRRVWGHAALFPQEEYHRSTRHVSARVRRATRRTTHHPHAHVPTLREDTDAMRRMHAGEGRDGSGVLIAHGPSSLAPSPAYTPALSPAFGASGGSHLSGPGSIDFESDDASLAAQMRFLSSYASSGSGTGVDSDHGGSWTPRTRTEHLLNRAQDEMMEHQQMEERARQKVAEQHARRLQMQNQQLAALQAAEAANPAATTSTATSNAAAPRA